MVFDLYSSWVETRFSSSVKNNLVLKLDKEDMHYPFRKLDQHYVVWTLKECKYGTTASLLDNCKCIKQLTCRHGSN